MLDFSKRLKRSNRQLGFALLGVALLGAAISLLFEKQALSLERSRLQASLAEKASFAASEVQRHLATNELAAKTIASHVEARFSAAVQRAKRRNPGRSENRPGAPRPVAGILSQRAFSRLVDPFFDAGMGLVNVAYSHDMRIVFVHPHEENSALVGADHKANPQQLAAIERAIATREYVLSGPVALMQDGHGLIGRMPVLTTGPDPAQETVLGFVSVVSSNDRIVSELRARIPNTRVAIGISPDADGQPPAILGDAEVFRMDPLVQSLTVGAQVWEIAMVPPDGWPTSSAYRGVILSAGGIVTLMVMLSIVLFDRANWLSRQSSLRLNAAIEGIQDGFALFDSNDRLVMCNQNYRAFYNRSAHLMVPGTSFETILRGGVALGQYPDAVGQEEAWIQERLAQHANPTGSIEQKLEDGRWLKIYESRLDDGSTVGFRVDITSLKEAQIEAERASKSKSEFLNTISHEIRTPLSAIIGFATILSNFEALRGGKGTPDDRNDTPPAADPRATDPALHKVKLFAARISENGRHLLALVDDLLFTAEARAELDNMPQDIVDMKSVVEFALEQLTRSAADKGLEVEVDLQPATVRGSETRLRQVALNLIGNAIKFTDHGKITVRLVQTGTSVKLTIMDTGVGIRKRDHDRIFEPFNQVDGSMVRRHNGSGLGLSISNEIVTRLGGAITVDSSKDLGSTFTVTLPSA